MTTAVPPTRPAREAAVPGLAVAGVAGALLLAVTNALVAATASTATSTADVVRQAGAHPVATEAVVATGLLAAVLLVPGSFAVAARLVPRARRTAALGAWLTGGAYVLSVALSVETATALAVSRSAVDPLAYSRALEEQGSSVLGVTWVVFGLGALLGVLLLGIAALRQGGAVPRWAGWALLASAPVRVVGLASGLPIGPPLASLLLAVGFAGVFVAGRRRP